ncbi:PP_RS20740 family protein [Solimonas marina]|uniref:Uncharacterized protein n=1 Tax=Solimonas marina TaxID=2714601 RepID=A0A969WBW3_9GAMM|nr:hypothetical protein [Solimonas marina]NKF24521.1 hypothetical protein [Solimonas marina]
MIAQPDAGDSESLEGVYEEGVPQHSEQLRRKTEFQAWHHPRKHYVRIHQWCHEVRALLDDLNLPEGSPFLYLTLPGNELLDVRTLHGVLARHRRPLRYLGFNNAGPRTADEQELNLSQNEVRSLEWVDRFSRVRQERLEALAFERNAAHGEVLRHGPFHAINLDLCNSICSRDPDDADGSHLGALRKLLELQLGSTSPWLLFITTRVIPDEISARNRAGFMRAIASNLEASDEFRQELAKLFDCEAADVEGSIEAGWGRAGVSLVRLFCTGIGKWLLSILTNAAPPRQLGLQSALYYCVGGAAPDMVSIALRCDTPKVDVHDPHGIFGVAAQAEALSETSIAVQLARSVAGCIDVDRLLAANAEARDRVMRQSTDILASARFERERYADWAAAQLAATPPPNAQAG